MNEYLIYTFGGFCQAPNGDSIDNCQVLGRAKGEDEVEAIENLLLENPWIIGSGYERKDFMIVQILNTYDGKYESYNIDGEYICVSRR